MVSTNPSEKYARQIGFTFPNFRGEHKTYLSCHHLVIFLVKQKSPVRKTKSLSCKGGTPLEVFDATLGLPTLGVSLKKVGKNSFRGRSHAELDFWRMYKKWTLPPKNMLPLMVVNDESNGMESVNNTMRSRLKVLAIKHLHSRSHSLMQVCERAGSSLFMNHRHMQR